MTPRPTATDTPTPVATATPTALVPPTPYTTIPSDWQTYRHEEYGFTFRYPPAWTVENPPAWTPFDNSNELPLFLELQRPGASLMIGAKQATAVDTSIVPTGIAAGDLFAGGTVRFFDQDIPIFRLIYENQLKGLFYGRVGDEIMAGHLAFFIALNGDREARYIEVNLDPAVVDEVAQILATFQPLEETQ